MKKGKSENLEEMVLIKLDEEIDTGENMNLGFECVFKNMFKSSKFSKFYLGFGSVLINLFVNSPYKRVLLVSKFQNFVWNMNPSSKIIF